VPPLLLTIRHHCLGLHLPLAALPSGKRSIQFRKKDLLGIKQLEPEEINLILETAETFKEISTRPIKKVPTLRGRTVVHLFYEPSTRTRTSFEIAAKRLSADTFNISASTSSIVKGETLLDTAKNLEAMNPDVIVLRHSAAGAPHLLAKHVQASVINAGDGMHEHPTQALLDLLTIKDKKKTISGQTVAIIGDIAHSRVARSNIWALTKMGARILVAGPTTMMPHDLDKLGVEVFYRPEDVIPEADVIMMLRIQLERQGQMLLPSLREYARVFGLNEEKLSQAKPDVLIMHPGPINRGVEISPSVADGPYSVILDQVNNGVAVRMALLYLLIGGEKDE
jgi:aspartate carbamoyltransferase catalytic subunit